MCGITRVIVVAVACCCLATLVIGAPVLRSNFDDIKAALKSQLKDQEKALESLASLSDKGTSGVEFAKSKTMTYSNINGAEDKYEKEEEKVSEPETSKLISDIKSELAQQKASPEAEVKSSYQASLDVPAENIHEQISNDDADEDMDELTNSESMNVGMNENLEFTPRVVAEYLYRTGETQEFQNLLNELVDASEITSEDAEQYEKAVMDELYKLEQERSIVNEPQLDELYQQGENTRPMFPMYDSMQGPNDVYPLYGYGQNAQPSSQESMADYVNYVLNKPVTLDEMINTIMDRWLTNAIVNGDQEADEILSNIEDYVSRDNDPNDEEQVKAILGDIFAEALLEDLTPRIEPQDLEIGQTQLNVAQPEVDEQQQQQPEIAPVEQSLPEVAPQKSKRAKEMQEPAPVAGEGQAVKM